LFIDTNIPYAATDPLPERLDAYQRLGVQGGFIDFPEFGVLKRVLKAKELEALSQTHRLRLIPRLTLPARNADALRQELKRHQDRTYLVALASTDPTALLLGARDARVDLISTPDASALAALTQGVLSLARQSETPVEISFRDLLHSERSTRSRIMRQLRRFFADVNLSRTKLVLGNGFQDTLAIRPPRQLIYVLHAVHKIPLHWLKPLVSDNPVALAAQHFKRCHHYLIEHGVELTSPAIETALDDWLRGHSVGMPYVEVEDLGDCGSDGEDSDQHDLDEPDNEGGEELQ
jgi:RNase P/RNase MRP subunit p30